MPSTRVDPDCPVCEAGILRVKDSRRDEYQPNVLRRRVKACDSCGYRCTTHEVIVADTMGLANAHTRNAIEFLRAVEAAADKHFGLTPTVRHSAGQIGARLTKPEGAN